MGAPKEMTNVENSEKVEELGQFAVNEYNTKEGKNLQFKKVVSAKEQVVQGVMYHLTIEASEGDEAEKLYEAKVWQKPGEEPKTLEKFVPKTSEAVTRITTQKLQVVSVDNPSVKLAAEQAMEAYNAKSNSLVRYELVQITNAHAKLIKVVDDSTPVSCMGKLGSMCGKPGKEQESYELEMTVSRGEKEESVKAEVHHSVDGEWTVKHVTPV